METAELQRAILHLRWQQERLEHQLGVERRRNEELRRENERLLQRVHDLEMRMRQDSVTSHQPSSQDRVWDKEARRQERNRRKAGKKRGAQKGHKGSRRVWVAHPDQVQRHEPSECNGCGQGLGGSAARLSYRYQLTELPELRCRVTEHQCYGKWCGGCGRWTVAKLPNQVKATGSFGPKLRSVLSLLTGYYRVSRRQAQQLMRDLFSVDLSLGAVSENEQRMSEALQPAYTDACGWMSRSAQLHADETTWTERHRLCWLWTAVNEKVCVYRIDPRRNTQAAQAFLGGFAGLLTTDRLGSYNFYPESKRQLCWAHIHREIKHIAEHDRHGKAWATQALRMLRRMFAQWNRIRDGTDPFDERRVLMKPFEAEMNALFDQGLTASSKPVRTLCRSLNKWRRCLWRFVLYATEPTNNRAERAIKAAVIWRKTSFGTQSARGSRFVERMLTAVQTLKLNARDVLQFLETTLHQALHGRPLPLLAPGA